MTCVMANSVEWQTQRNDGHAKEMWRGRMLMQRSVESWVVSQGFVEGAGGQ